MFNYQQQDNNNETISLSIKSTKSLQQSLPNITNISLKDENLKETIEPISTDETSDDSVETQDKKQNENERLIELYGPQVFEELSRLDKLTVFPKNYLAKHDIDSKSR